MARINYLGDTPRSKSARCINALSRLGHLATIPNPNAHWRVYGELEQRNVENERACYTISNAAASDMCCKEISK